MVTMLIGMGYPLNPADSELDTTTWWRAFYIAPIPFLLVALIQNFCEHTNDGLLFHVQRNEKKQSLEIIKRIYPDTSDEIRERIYQDLRAKETRNQGSGEEVKKESLG